MFAAFRSDGGEKALRPFLVEGDEEVEVCSGWGDDDSDTEYRFTNHLDVIKPMLEMCERVLPVYLGGAE